MLYEFNNKLYFKVENYYKEVKVENNSIVVVKDSKTIYESQAPKDLEGISLEEYIKKSSNKNNSKRKEII